MSAHVLNKIAHVGRFDEDRGAGMACRIDVEAALGLSRQHDQPHIGDDQSSL